MKQGGWAAKKDAVSRKHSDMFIRLYVLLPPSCQPFPFFDVPDADQMFTQRVRSPSIISSLPFLQLVPTAPRSDQDFFVTELFQDPLQLSTAAMKHLKGMIDGGNLMVWLCFCLKKRTFSSNVCAEASITAEKDSFPAS